MQTAPGSVAKDDATGHTTGDADVLPMVEHLRAALIEVMHGQRRHLERHAAQYGLSAQLAIALRHLCWPSSMATLGPCGATPPEERRSAEDGMPMRELAGRISCDPSQVTGIADRLEELAFVERRPSPEDRRVKLLVVTEDGARVCAELAAAINQDAPGFSALSGREQLQLLELLRKVADDSAP